MFIKALARYEIPTMNYMGMPRRPLERASPRVGSRVT